MLQATVKQTAPDEITVLDGEFELAALHSAQVKRFVVRMATNCTARLKQWPARKKKGRRCEYGAMRAGQWTHGGNRFAAIPAHPQVSFVFAERTIRSASWYRLITSQTKVNPAQ